MPRYGRPKPIRWAVYLRGELPGHVYADNWPAACERAVRALAHFPQKRFKIKH
jgi:hypothetical protein